MHNFCYITQLGGRYVALFLYCGTFPPCIIKNIACHSFYCLVPNSSRIKGACETQSTPRADSVPAFFLPLALPSLPVCMESPGFFNIWIVLHLLLIYCFHGNNSKLRLIFLSSGKIRVCALINFVHFVRLGCCTHMSQHVCSSQRTAPRSHFFPSVTRVSRNNLGWPDLEASIFANWASSMTQVCTFYDLL